MTLFEQILAESSLLLEKANEVTVDKIKDAIENCKIVSIMYNDGKGGGGKSWRYIYPVVYGELKDRKTGAGTGNMAVRAYQTVGSTKRGKNAWKLFRVDRIVAWYNQENTPEDMTHTFTRKDLDQLFNDNGDKYFSHIDSHSPFMDVKYLIDAEPISKQDIKSVEPGKESDTAQATVKYVPNPDWANQYDQGKGISLDNQGNVSYNSEKAESDRLTAPETEPVTDADVQTPGQESEPSQDTAKLVADDKPITKNEVNGTPEDNDLTKTYTNMMNRWKNNEEEGSYS